MAVSTSRRPRASCLLLLGALSLPTAGVYQWPRVSKCRGRCLVPHVQSLCPPYPFRNPTPTPYPYPDPDPYPYPYPDPDP